MPDESRASVAHRALSWQRRLTAVQAAGLIVGMSVAVAMLYAVSAAGAASTGGRDLTTPPLAGADNTAPRLQLGDGMPLATATATASPTLTPPTATATLVPPPAPAAPAPPPAAAPPSVERPALAAPPPTSPPPPAPTSTSVPAPPAPQGLDTSPMDPYAQALFDDTNQRRIGAGLAPLRANGWLVGIARLRSQDMAQYHYFAHVSPVTGDNAFSLMDKHGVPYGWAGENLAENNYPLSDAVAVADAALWNSPPHRENILGPNYTDMGIALAVDAAGMNYFTIIFTGPP